MVTHGKRLLVVDDDPGVTDWLVESLSDLGFVVEGVTDPEVALKRIELESYDLVISDVEMPGMRGLDLLQAIHGVRPDQLVILITAFGSIDLAMKCVRRGAADFLAKPFTPEALLLAIERTLRERRMKREIVRLRASLATDGETGALVAESTAMKEVLEIARRAARTSSTVFLTGESGSGKSAVARFIHERSGRAGRELVQLNCAAIPAGLVEAELFGVRKGAFTDARADRQGLFSRASGGTMFLDEIGEMSLEVQPKLLLALESGTFRPVGGAEEVAFDLRLIAATNRPPEEAVERGALRADLYHRLNVIRIEIPPLRDRMADIPALVDRFLDGVSARAGREVVGVTEDCMRWLCAQHWPGNVRELANVIERAVMLSDHDVLTREDFERGAPSVDEERDLLARAAELGLSLDELESRYIELVLDRCQGNKAQAARVLGIDRSTLWRKLGGGS